MKGGHRLSIISALNEFLKTNNGKKKIMEAQAKSNYVSDFQNSFYKTMVDDLISCIIDFLPPSLKTNREHSLLNRSSYIIHGPKFSEGSSYKIEVSFSDDAVFRPSLVPQRWNGIPNIVLHLSNGWRANGSVSGLWHGEYTQSRRSFVGDPFMKEAISEFNFTHSGVTARLSDAYYR